MEPVLEVGIGLILAVAALSVVVSSAMELISAALRLRAKSLEQGLARMLDDQRRVPKGRGQRLGVRRPDRAGPAAAAVLQHPLVKALSSGRATDRAPSYIDAVTFATALLGSSLETPALVAASLGAPDDVATAVRSLAGDGVDVSRARAAWRSAGLDVGRFAGSLLGDADGRAILTRLLGDRATLQQRVVAAEQAGLPVAAPLGAALAEADAGGTFDAARYLAALAEAPSITEARQAGMQLQDKLADIARFNPHLGASLQALSTRAGGELAAFRTEIEDWFDREMARVSGWYSRWAQWVMVVVGVVLAVVLNVSLVTVGKVLWQDPTLREAIADSAPTTSVPAGATADASGDDGGAVPAGTAAPVDTSGAVGSTPPSTSVPAADETANEPAASPRIEELRAQGLPIGWNSTAWPGTQWYLLLHVLGVLMAGIATSFGAPFWFDLLNRVVNLRAAGAPPPTAAATRRAP